MKKIIITLFISLLAYTGTSTAQIIHGSTYSSSTTYKSRMNLSTHYQGELNFGYGLGGKIKEDGEKYDANYSRAFIETIHGVRINKYAFAGVGVGFQYAYDEEWEMGTLPIFVDLKGYYPVTADFAPYLAIDLGYSVGLFSNGGDTPGGFYASYGIGLNYRKLNFGIGWQHQAFSDYDAKINSFFVKIGIKF